MEATIDQATIESLAAKLATLELTADERDALELLYERAGRVDDEAEEATGAEVAGFGFDAREQVIKRSPLDLSAGGLKLGVALGVAGSAPPHGG